jgi:hypothetical protein
VRVWKEGLGTVSIITASMSRRRCWVEGSVLSAEEGWADDYCRLCGGLENIFLLA